MVSVYHTVSVYGTVSVYNMVSVNDIVSVTAWSHTTRFCVQHCFSVRDLPLRQCAGARTRVGERITPAHTTSSIGEITTTFTNHGNAYSIVSITMYLYL